MEVWIKTKKKKEKIIENSVCSQQVLALVSCCVCFWRWMLTASNQSFIPERGDFHLFIPGKKNRCCIKGSLWSFLCTQTPFFNSTLFSESLRPDEHVGLIPHRINISKTLISCLLASFFFLNAGLLPGIINLAGCTPEHFQIVTNF